MMADSTRRMVVSSRDRGRGYHAAPQPPAARLARDGVVWIMGAQREASMKATAFVLVPVLAAAGCEGGPSPAAPPAHATVVQSSVALGDPHIVSDSVNRLNILFSIYEALVAIDEHGGYQPALAERWSVADDARTWTFTLRKGVTFHNGDDPEGRGRRGQHQAGARPGDWWRLRHAGRARHLSWHRRGAGPRRVHGAHRHGRAHGRPPGPGGGHPHRTRTRSAAPAHDAGRQRPVPDRLAG